VPSPLSILSLFRVDPQSYLIVSLLKSPLPAVFLICISGSPTPPPPPPPPPVIYYSVVKRPPSSLTIVHLFFSPLQYITPRVPVHLFLSSSSFLTQALIAFFMLVLFPLKSSLS